MKIQHTQLSLGASGKPLIVGVIGSRQELHDALMNIRLEGVNLRPLTDLKAVGGYEIRFDKIREDFRSKKLEGWQDLIKQFAAANEASSNPKPLIMTARDVSEGGVCLDWTVADRAALYRAFMSHATWIDIEARTAFDLAGIIKEAKAAGVGIIISFHSLEAFPPCSKIHSAVGICADIGGDIFKMAIMCQTNDDHISLQDEADIIRKNHPFLVAAMATGERYGIFSRYLDTIHGGPFIYAFIGEQVVAGQPKAIDVPKALGMLVMPPAKPAN
jgi:3-dehydroquinate dehydratase type I